MDIWQWILTTILYLGSAHGLGNFRLPEDRESNHTTNFFEQKIDHFSFALNKTFKQRYHVRDQFWKSGGPIIYYIGAEERIDYPREGFMMKVAEEVGGLLVDAEHRFYGESQPFEGTMHENFGKIEQNGYLTSWQALADYATLISHLKSSKPGAEKSPVIAYGGSYGGMLSAWMRVKYPHLIDGAISSSAPMLQTTRPPHPHPDWSFCIFDAPVEVLASFPWWHQTCSEMIWTHKEGSVISYPCTGISFTEYSEKCLQTFNITISTPNAAKTMYGEDDLKHASNIVFSNGGIDRWTHWGILKNINPSIEAVFIPEGKHCGDLSFVDGVYTEAQNIERKHIEKWINEANSRNNNAL